MKRALICGVTGQDGAYLADSLLRKGYEVFGTSRDARTSKQVRLRWLGIKHLVQYHSLNMLDTSQVTNLLEDVRPDEIYNLAGQSSVGKSFAQPRETFDSIAIANLNLLEATRQLGLNSRIFNAGSSECFGDTGSEPANEKTALRPINPYGTAKASAYWQTATYRENFGLFACTGILFNHESPLRSESFVTRKITTAVHAIRAGQQQTLKLGNLGVARDWGWAPEYVEAMWAMLQQDEADDFVIATGETHKLEEFVASAFAEVDLDWRDYVTVEPEFVRATDIPVSHADPRKAHQKLGWQAKNRMTDVIKAMVEADAVSYAARQIAAE